MLRRVVEGVAGDAVVDGAVADGLVADEIVELLIAAAEGVSEAALGKVCTEGIAGCVVTVAVEPVAVAVVGGHRVDVVADAGEVVAAPGAAVVDAAGGVGLAIGRGNGGMS